MANPQTQEKKRSRYSEKYEIVGGPNELQLMMSLHRQTGFPPKSAKQVESETAVTFLRAVADIIPMADGMLGYTSCINGMERRGKDGNSWKLKGVILAFEKNPRRPFVAVYDTQKRTGRLFTN